MMNREFPLSILKKVDELTIEDLVKIAEENNIPMQTKISIMGAETKYVIAANGCILLDERNCIEELI